MKRIELCAIVGVGLLFGGCAFDGNTDFEPSFEEPLLDTDEPGAASPGTAPEAEVVSHVAIGEETRRGSLVAGTFQESFAVDGLVEVIEAEVRGGKEELEHKWHFDSIPAGDYQLTLVGLPFSPEPVDTFVVEYAEDGVRGHRLVLTLNPSEAAMTYEGDMTLQEGAAIEIRVKLPRDTQAAGNDETPFRRIDVDYLALTPNA